MANYRENNFYWASDLHFYSVTSDWSNSVQNLRDWHTENDFYEYSSRRPTRNSLARRQSNVPTLMMCWNWNSSRNNTGRDGREQRGAPAGLETWWQWTVPRRAQLCDPRRRERIVFSSEINTVNQRSTSSLCRLLPHVTHDRAHAYTLLVIWRRNRFQGTGSKIPEAVPKPGTRNRFF